MKKIIKVKVSAGAKQDKIEETLFGDYKIRVRERAERGKANAKVIEIIAQYFDISKSKVSIERGVTQREKIIKITL